MCLDETCPKRKTCERSPESGTKAGHWQSWIHPLRKGDHCEDYIPTRKEAK
jgi:hypothetical protein